MCTAIYGGGWPSVRLKCCLLVGVVLLLAGSAEAQVKMDAPSTAPEPHAATEAWWTGPIIAASANTLPKGHVLIEPYLFDARSAASDYLGSLTYLLYGATDRLTIGAYPTYGSYHSRGSGHARKFGLNDLTLNAEFNLRRSRPGSLAPAVAMAVQEIIPIGRYDRLGDDPDRAIGGGSWGTNLCVYTQTTIVMPNGRPLRVRLDATETISMHTRTRGRSIFGTPSAFEGRAREGDGSFVDLSIEYSASRRFVLALELFGRWTHSGSVDGAAEGKGFHRGIPSGNSYGLAPAVEYSWNSNWGVLVGVRRIQGVRSVSNSTTPVLALNFIL